MEQLHEQLLQRWEQAFDQLKTLPSYKAQIRTTQYSDGLRYDLKNFEWDCFPSQGSLMSDKAAIDSSDVYEYGFNEDGRPCYVSFGHGHNQTYGRGSIPITKTL